MINRPYLFIFCWAIVLISCAKETKSDEPTVASESKKDHRRVSTKTREELEKEFEFWLDKKTGEVLAIVYFLDNRIPIFAEVFYKSNREDTYKQLAANFGVMGRDFTVDFLRKDGEKVSYLLKRISLDKLKSRLVKGGQEQIFIKVNEKEIMGNRELGARHLRQWQTTFVNPNSCGPSFIVKAETIDAHYIFGGGTGTTFIFKIESYDSIRWQIQARLIDKIRHKGLAGYNTNLPFNDSLSPLPYTFNFYYSKTDGILLMKTDFDEGNAHGNFYTTYGNHLVADTAFSKSVNWDKVGGIPWSDLPYEVQIEKASIHHLFDN